MSQNTDRLTTLVNTAPDRVEQIEGSISQIENNIEGLTKEKDAIEDGVCANAESTAVVIIETIILPTFPVGSYVVYGSEFGDIQWDPKGNISDWAIWKDITVPNPLYPPTPPPTITTPTLLYTYVNNGTYPDIDVLVDDYDFGNDNLTRPLTDGATYGIIPRIDSLTTASNILNENSNKVSDSIDVFSRYAT
jgi:hypothetical protein